MWPLPGDRAIAYMGPMKACFFDLDGTLADSRAGLYPSLRAACERLGINPPDDSELTRFLGTPLPRVFRSYRPDLTDAEIDAGMQAFRAVYENTGIRDNELYPGVIEMLAAAQRRGMKAWIVTSKPEPQASRVAQLLQIDRLVEGVIGAGLAETDTKTDLVSRAIAAAAVVAGEAVMVGDRHYDVIGALENGVRPVGALWGFGTYDELHRAGCRHFAHSPDEFRELFVETDRGFDQVVVAAAE